MPPSPPPCVVLDTNVVLDWLVFENPHSQRIGRAIEQGSLHWIAGAHLRDELSHVLSRGVASDWNPDRDRLWRTWDRWAQHRPPPSEPTLPALRCTDPDDQKFIDFALAHAQWLISRDRAVLKIARRAALHGLRVVTPECWALPTAEHPALPSHHSPHP